ncbi:CHAP domain-containing protein [Tyzzerella sp. OttesenSCG-928-J15]|nr:CHAP domain-containing protein [Tyzzerella sp. OttesenSCG-928-J15]
MKKRMFNFIGGFVLGGMVFSAVTVHASNIVATLSTQGIKVNGTAVSMEAYNINGSNYVKLRDIAKATDSFNVTYDEATSTVLIDKNSSYQEVSNAASANQAALQTEMPKNDMIPINATQNQNTAVETATAATTDRQRQPALTEAPIIGSQLAKILVDENVSPYNADGKVNRDNFNGAYWVGNIGQCTWYASARFYEALAINNYTYTNLFTSVGKSAGISLTTWLDNADREDLPTVYSIREASDIVPQSIAVWDGPNSSGHVVFVEYVEYDSNGNPTEVYFSEANHANDVDGQFRPNVDGVIKKQSFNDFINRSNHANYVFKGYIAAK